MRKNKGYIDDPKHRHATGTNKTPEQILEDVNKKFDERIKECKRSYEKIATKTTLEGKALRDYCRDQMLWEVKFDKDNNLIPLETQLKIIENFRQRDLGSCLYSKWSGYTKRIIHKDNQKFVYNSGGGGSGQRVRIPSLKRSKSVWRNFYDLFPWYEKASHDPEQRRIYKLKRI